MPGSGSALIWPQQEGLKYLSSFHSLVCQTSLRRLKGVHGVQWLPFVRQEEQAQAAIDSRTH